MQVIGRIFFWLLGLLIAALAAASVWFWWAPVGVNNYINKVSIELAIDSPELLTQLGFIDNTPLDFHSGRLADYTEAQEDKSLAKLRNARAGLDKYGPEGLEGQELLSWNIFSWFLDDLLRQSEIKVSGYRENQLNGVAVNIPQFLTDAHVIKNETSVKRYIARVREFGRVLGEVKARVEDDRARGVTPPDFVLEKAIIGMRAFIEAGAAGNPLVTTLPAKLDKIDKLSADKKAAYVADATKAVETAVIPGYRAMIALFEEMLTTTDHDAGIWRIADGEKIYANALKSNTTTDLTADELHDIGLSEVARIEAGMDVILTGQGFPKSAAAKPLATGEKPAPGQTVEFTLTERIDLVSAMPGQTYPNTAEGRQAMLDYLVRLNTDVMALAGKYFVTLPPQPLEIVRVPEYSENSAPGGYYNPPALDGSRPGRFYINLKDTADNPRWTLPTLLYHEAAPGHHFQISAGMLIKNVPIIRKLGPFTAYAEGWALYAERLAADDMNMYAEDPLGDLGRLQAEMFRAVRLVVDTGMHHKRWTREQAIDYMLEKTGMTEGEVTREIERYVVMPGQACAYKTGQLAILRMRAKAEAELGEAFDLPRFHETILGNGGMPLGILEDVIDQWIATEKKAA